MKKMLKNKKGFSLVELVIVIAIMGVLAAVAISMFNGMIQRSRRQADKARAQQIQKAIVTYITETGDSSLEQVDHSSVDALLEWLQKQQTVTFSDGTENKVGPYLENIRGEASADNYNPQEDTKKGWSIKVYKETGEVFVEAIEDGDDDDIVQEGTPEIVDPDPES